MTKIKKIHKEKIKNEELNVLEFFLVLTDEYDKEYYIPVNFSTHLAIEEKDDSVKPTIWKLFKDITRTIGTYTITHEENGEFYGLLEVDDMELRMRISDMFLTYWPNIEVFINVDNERETTDIDKLIDEAFKNDNFDEALRLKKIKENSGIS